MNWNCVLELLANLSDGGARMDEPAGGGSDVGSDG